MNTLPYDAPCTYVYNTRIPTAWYTHLKTIADAKNMAVHTYVAKAIRSKVSKYDEQQIAVSEGISITAVRQRILEELHPTMPKWYRGKSRIRSNTPTAALSDGKSRSVINAAPEPRFKITVPLSQHAYYTIKKLAGNTHIPEEVLARRMLMHGLNGMTMAEATKPQGAQDTEGIEHVDR